MIDIAINSKTKPKLSDVQFNIFKTLKKTEILNATTEVEQFEHIDIKKEIINGNIIFPDKNNINIIKIINRNLTIDNSENIIL